MSDHALACLANGAPDQALAVLVGRAEQAGLQTMPAIVPGPGDAARSRRLLRAALEKTIAQLNADHDALFKE